jgi:chromosome segregation ATPase
MSYLIESTLHSSFLSLETVTDQRNQMAIADQNMKTLENEIKQHSFIEQKLNNTINKVKKEKEQMTEDLQNLSDRFDGVNEELNAKNYQINDYKDKLVESQARLLKIQHDLQSAQNDFINVEKELQVSKDTQEELKEKLKVRCKTDSN